MQKTLIGLAIAGAISLAMVPAAQAGMCEGVVRGLSRHYNQYEGSGFLAVRTKPTSSARKVGELYNGDRVEVFRRKGNWYRVASLSNSLEGWAHARWIRNECGY
ncbi:MAG TPA: SH3 domain-containing protein [Alphaproteobacteria bacterium]|nr:SH3 domain-containing protein [Alphaproteobacteria bacterium]